MRQMAMLRTAVTRATSVITSASRARLRSALSRRIRTAAETAMPTWAVVGALWLGFLGRFLARSDEPAAPDERRCPKAKGR